MTLNKRREKFIVTNYRENASLHNNEISHTVRRYSDLYQNIALFYSRKIRNIKCCVWTKKNCSHMEIANWVSLDFKQHILTHSDDKTFVEGVVLWTNITHLEKINI